MKPISNGSPANGMGSGSLASPTSGVWAETFTSPSVKLRRSGAFFWAMRLMRRTTSRSSSRDTRQLVLVGLGQQLAVVGELAVDQPARERDAADLEHDLVRRGRRSRISSTSSRTRRPSSSSARAGTLASKPPSSGASSRVSFTLSR